MSHKQNQKRDPLSEQIAKTLAKRIITGLIAPGSKLRQDHIAEEFGASHVPVREAFRKLETQGLAVSEPRRGVRVSSFSRKDMAEVAEMRSTLEALALRHAAPHITPAILKKAEQWTQIGENANNVVVWEEANRQFHRTILEPCNMPRLIKTIHDLQMISSRHLFSGWRAEWDAPTDRDHRAIVNALRLGRIELAVTTLLRHVKRSG